MGRDQGFLYRSPVEFRVQYRSLDDFVVAFTNNINKGTMFVLSSEPLPVGTEVTVLLELPDVAGEGPTVPCQGRVAYFRDEAPSGMGLDLFDVPSTILRALLVDALADETRAHSPSTPPRGRVLLVDDHAGTRRSIRQALSSRFPLIEEASSGLDGLGKALADPPSLILSDVEMPEMDGWQFLRLVRSRPKLQSVPFVFLTQLRSEADRLRAYELGVDDFLSKPVDAEDLQTRLTGLLLRPARTAKERDVLSGDLKHVSLPSVLSFISHERRSGRLTVVSAGRVATLAIEGGDILRVELAGSESSTAAAFEVLEFQEGYFEFAPGSPEGVNEVGLGTTSLLLEFARMVDERSA